jgi:hypothetical protein
MSTTARTIITAAFRDIGVLGEGEDLSAAQGADGLRRLNGVVSSLNIQPGTSNAVIRYVFPLVDNKQTYTVGLGGDFNIQRPSVNDVQGAGLLLQSLGSPASVTSISRTLYVATVTQTAHGYAVGDETLIAGANEIDYNGIQTVQTVPTANTFTFTVNGLPVTPATGTLTSAEVLEDYTEIPRIVMTNSAYQAIQLKNMDSGLFTNVYYNPTFPYGQIYLWPKPDTTVNQLALYLNTIFTAFANLVRVYDWPSLPGYSEMLQYQLGKRLAIAYSREWRADLEQMAVETMGLVKRSNNRLTDWPTDASILTHNLRGGYNIDTDQGGN